MHAPPRVASADCRFDFPGLRYRADLFYLSGNENPLTTIYNSSSYWIGSKLSIITWPDARSLQNASCVQLDLGFGIMRPDWMVQGECRGDVWLSQKSDGTDPNYHRVSFTHIPVLAQDDGAFDWYSSYSGGAGFQMQAPGQRCVRGHAGWAGGGLAGGGGQPASEQRPCRWRVATVCAAHSG